MQFSQISPVITSQCAIWGKAASSRLLCLGVLLALVGVSGPTLGADQRGVPIPPPDLVLHSHAKVPRVAAYTLTTLYGGSLGWYAGTVAMPIILGQRHGQPGMTTLSALLGVASGGILGFAYSTTGDGSLSDAHSLIHYHSLGMLAGIGVGNFFGSRGNSRGAEYSSGLIGSVGGTLLALGMQSAGLTDHGSLLWGTYAGLLTAAGTVPMAILVNFDADASLGLALAPGSLVGLLTSLVLAPMKPDPLKASVMFLSSSLCGGTAAFVVAGVSPLARSNGVDSFVDFNDLSSAQAWGGLAGATLGLLVATPLYDWISLKWLQTGPKKRQMFSSLRPWSTLVTSDRTRPYEQALATGVQWQFD